MLSYTRERIPVFILDDVFLLADFNNKKHNNNNSTAAAAGQYKHHSHTEHLKTFDNQWQQFVNLTPRWLLAL